MKFEELTSNIISTAGNIIAAGQSTNNSQETKKVFTEQYPAERSASFDATDSVDPTQTYQNGLLFSAYNYTSRTTPDLRSMRNKQQKIFKSQKLNKIASSLSNVTSNKSTSEVKKDLVANILMPRSKTDADVSSHKFNDVGESLITKGNGTITGALSSMASTAVFGGIESITQGALSDKGEQIYNTARSMYAGADNRRKVYTWELTPRTPQDLVSIVKINEIFNWLSYGNTGQSAWGKELKAKIDDWYKDTFIKPITDSTDVNNYKTFMESVTSFLSNVIVVTNPTVWFIQNFGTQTNFDGVTDIFGPAQIESIRFDKSPDGNFNGLAIAPNMPSTFVLEITFREILTLNRASIYGEDIL